MRRFADLYDALDASTGTGDKVAALVRYFGEAPPEDAAWAVYFLAGGKPRQVLPTALLREAACRRAGIDDWLFEECYQAVGDLAETIAHILPAGQHISNAGLAEWVEQRVLALRGLAPAEQTARIVAAWDELDAGGRFLLLKLIGGGFRVGVSKLLVQRALALHAGLDAKLVAQRLVGWTDARATPSAARLQALLAPPAAAGVGGAIGAGFGVGPGGLDGRSPASEDSGQPYPFFLAHALQADSKHFARRSASRPTGWWNGSTTAYAPRSSSGVASCGYGRAAKSWSATAFLRWSPRRPAGRTARSSMVNCSSGPMMRSRRRRSTCCSSESGARP
jgi:DNA ligase-1